MKALDATASGTSVSLYIHIPFCLKKCSYCDFFSRTPKESALFCAAPNQSNIYIKTEYITCLLNQIRFLAEKFGAAAWKSVYIGGGTPSLIRPEDIKTLCKGIQEAAPLDAGAEFTIEANPGGITPAFLRAAQDGGINRLSVGIQSANDEVLKAAGRLATRAQIERALDFIKEIWRSAWSADFIAGLPLQTEEILKKDLCLAIANGASHISLYSLCIESGTPLEKSISSGKTPYDADYADGLWLAGRDYLEENGYLQYEVSNFAKKGFESRHNLCYWTQQDYLGAGAGAAGTVYSKGKGKSGMRFANTKDIGEYVSFWKDPERSGLDIDNMPGEVEALSLKTQEFEFLMMALRTLRGVSGSEYKARYGGDLAERLGAEGGVFEKWCKKGLARAETYGSDIFCSLTREGILFLNRFLEAI